MRETVTITEGPAGTGKSFARCAVFLTEEFLPEEVGGHLSNFPIFKEVRPDCLEDGEVQGTRFVDRISDHVVNQWGGEREKYLARLQMIPPEVEATWREDVAQGGSGPWDFFVGKDVTGLHLAIDEGHTVCGRHHSVPHRKRWMEFLGEARHRGLTVEFLTQDAMKLAKEIEREAGTLFSLVSGAKRRDPVLSIAMEDWYELRAAFVTGKYTSRTWRIEHRKQKGRWIAEETRSWPLEPRYFRLYDSYDAPKHGGEAATNPPQREFERRSKTGLVLWFIEKNAIRLLPRMAAGIFIFYMAFLGGAESLMANVMAAARGKGNSIQKAGQVSQAERVKNGHEAVDAAIQKLRDKSGPVPAGVVGQVVENVPPEPPAAAPPAPPVPRPRWCEVCGLVPGGVMLKAGFVVKVGERFDDESGPLVDSVNPRRGTFSIDGGMHSLAEAAEERDRYATPVREFVSGGAAIIANARAEADGVPLVPSGSDAPAVVSDVAGGASGGVDRVASSTRSTNGDSDNARRLAERRAANRRPPAWRGGGTGGQRLVPGRSPQRGPGNGGSPSSPGVR